MKRSVHLHGLSSDHHHALVLAKRIREAADAGWLDAAHAAEVRRRYDEELAPHFAIEEEELLPALELAGQADVADRTLHEHRDLRGHIAAAEAGDLPRLAAFAALLEAHVRFEERDLFTACEALLPSDVLERVARLAPKGKKPGYGAPPVS
jgi:hypothetical protein